MVRASKKNEKQQLQSRIAFLYKAATQLSKVEQQQQHNASRHASDTCVGPSGINATEHGVHTASQDVEREGGSIVKASDDCAEPKPTVTGGLSHLYISHLRTVSQKNVLRLPSDIKRAICKRCDAVLEDGSTATITMENTSRKGRKPHANIRQIKCNNCGATKRFPEGAQRQPRKTSRSKVHKPPRTQSP